MKFPIFLECTNQLLVDGQGGEYEGNRKEIRLPPSMEVTHEHTRNMYQ